MNDMSPVVKVQVIRRIFVLLTKTCAEINLHDQNEDYVLKTKSLKTASQELQNMVIRY